MELWQVQVGRGYYYFPPKHDADDNRHFLVIVLEVKNKTVKMLMFTTDAPEGVVRHVSAKRLVDQGELWCDTSLDHRWRAHDPPDALG